MYDVRQFRLALYLLLLLGMSGFALATESATLWVLGCGAILLNGWLVRTKRFAPMPRLMSNIVTVLGLIWVIRESRVEGATEVVIIGDYLVLLHLVKLYEQRGNRDYAQLLILGLLLMVAGSINTVSLGFGIILIVYLFLSLYCCLLFHLKVEADNAKEAMSIPEDAAPPVSLRQDQRNLNQSMRRLTLLVACVSIVFAVAVFLFFPRGKGEGMLAPLQFRPSQTLSGFSNDVSFQQLAKITQSQQVVAYAQVWKNDKPAGGTELLLRGTTLEHYNGADSRHGPRWTWTHASQDEDEIETDHDHPTVLTDFPPAGDKWRQRITLRPTGTSVLFTIGSPISVSTRRPARLEYTAATQTLHAAAIVVEPIEYDVVSSESLEPPPNVELRPPEPVSVDPKILEMARRPEVSGSNAGGSLSAQRQPTPPHVDPLDAQIALHIETYLKTHYAYTLDLTDARQIEGVDPIVAFLYDFKRGHCEFFAGAMTLMCQSLGMDARLVVGFKCDEYNEMGEHYIVRQSQAHAWVEVRTTEGWKTFDPTSGTEADLASRPGDGWWQRIKHAVDYLEYTYADNVIAYDNDDRQNLIQNTESRMMSVANGSRSQFDDLGSWAQTVRFWNASSTFLSLVLWLMLASLAIAFLAFFWEKWKLRRRAARIGIDALPVAEQERLARQLAFYDNLLLMLGKHRIVRPRNLTPMEFCDSLLFLPTDVYRTTRRLTQLFYRVRFGRAELSAGQRKRLETVLARLNEGLSGALSAES